MGANELVISVPPPTYHTAASVTELNKAIVQYMGRSGEVTVKVPARTADRGIETVGGKGHSVVMGPPMKVLVGEGAKEVGLTKHYRIVAELEAGGVDGDRQDGCPGICYFASSRVSRLQIAWTLTIPQNTLICVGKYFYTPEHFQFCRQIFCA